MQEEDSLTLLVMLFSHKSVGLRHPPLVVSLTLVTVTFEPQERPFWV